MARISPRQSEMLRSLARMNLVPKHAFGCYVITYDVTSIGLSKDRNALAMPNAGLGQHVR